MPTYDYLCETNGKLLEVRHKMDEVVSTWGELCARLELETGDTDPEAPVKKLATGGQVVRSGSLGDAAPACGQGACDACQFS